MKKNIIYFSLAVLIIWNVFITYKLFFADHLRFRTVSAERVDIVEKDGLKKLGLFSSDRYQKGKSQRQGENTIAGMLFFNEEGYEAGGLVYDGKAVGDGQKAGIGLMFDGYRQDQTIAIQHNERKDSTQSFYEDGIRIIARPDYMDVKTEYQFYKLKYPEKFGLQNENKYSEAELDSIQNNLARQNKVATRRVFLGTKRGSKNGELFDETGLEIRNRLGKAVMKIYVDESMKPKFEVYDSLGEKKIYDLIPGKDK